MPTKNTAATEFWKNIGAVTAILVVLSLLGAAVSLRLGIFLFLGFGAMSVLSMYEGKEGRSTWFTRQLSVPFWISFVVILALLAEYVLPAWFVDAAPDVGHFIGVPFASLDPARLFVTGIIGLIVYWVLEIYLTGSAVNADTIASRMQTQAERLVSRYVTIGRIIAAFGLSIVFMLFREAGQFMGEAGAWFAEVPFVTSSISIGLGGWMSLGGTLPYVGSVPLLGSMTQGEFLVFFLLVLAVAAAVKYND